ncbi:MAG: RNA polymerase sigma factor [Ruminococcaceae bacterium]|nr:RNA polymerase sigma factor [Oscillospiraceae bacterium]
MIYLTSVNEYSSRESASAIDRLIESLSCGNMEALEELYIKTKNAVYGFALSILKNTYDAEDVLQSCFVAVFNSAPSYKSCGKPMAWILTIAKNLCYGKLREKGRTEELGEEMLYDLNFSEEMKADDRIFLQYCIKSLDDEERQILTLHAVAGLKHREISQLLSLPIGTVLSKYNRSVRKIKERFKGGYISD